MENVQTHIHTPYEEKKNTQLELQGTHTCLALAFFGIAFD
jgi:hypothetical protein